MNWWEIVKNQIASTKGKTFQLDFSEPMIEDEPCKEKLKNIFRTAHKKHTIMNINRLLNDIDNMSEETACRILENRGKSGTLVKRQIASTKGKTFQLDFNQPMIEEEDNCKERLIKMIDTLNKIDLRDYFMLPHSKNKMSVGYFEEREGDYKLESGSVANYNYIKYYLVNDIFENFNNITEEAACYVLEELKKGENNSKTGVFVIKSVKENKKLYILNVVINSRSFPESLALGNGGQYVLGVTVDLINHSVYFVDEVCDIKRLEGDILKIIDNA